jgi:hypothetical protein
VGADHQYERLRRPRRAPDELTAGLAGVVMNVVDRIADIIGRRPRFEVRTVPVLDDVRAVLWMEVPPGMVVACRALFEFDTVPGVRPQIREEWGGGRDREGTDTTATSGPVVVPPRAQFDPATVAHPRFRVKWTTSAGRTREATVEVSKPTASAHAGTR